MQFGEALNMVCDGMTSALGDALNIVCDGMT